MSSRGQRAEGMGHGAEGMETGKGKRGKENGRISSPILRCSLLLSINQSSF